MKDLILDMMTDDEGLPLAVSPTERGQVGTIISVVTIGIVAIIGVLIYGQVLQATGDPSTTDAVNRTELENSTVGVTDGFGSAMNLVPVVLIVMVASLVIMVVQQFSR